MSDDPTENGDAYLGDGYWLSMEHGRAVTRRMAYHRVGFRLVCWMSGAFGW